MQKTYPLSATFPFIQLSPGFQVRDAKGGVLLVVKQQLFTLTEATTVYTDEALTQPSYEMKANQIIGFGATHTIHRLPERSFVGSVKAEGVSSLWRAGYTIRDNENEVTFRVEQEKPWLSFVEAIADLLDAIPLIGPILSFLIAWWLNPSYLLKDAYGRVRYRIVKRRSFFERSFWLEGVEEVPPDWEELVMLVFARVVQLERHRG